jgi:SAM-dependent methyltransferase
LIGEKDIPEIWAGECPLCKEKGGHNLFFTDKFRPYYRCGHCTLIFVPSPWHIRADREKARYDLHQNDPADQRYRDFLGRIIPFMEESFTPGTVRGLDFGCGPGPVLGEMLTEKGYEMSLYDLYFRDDRSVLTEKTYDFIVSTEVVEHLSDPMDILEHLLQILDKKGTLALMTRFYDDKISFKTWFYKDDETHICFFTKESLLWFGEYIGGDVYFRDKDMVIFKRRKTDNERYER